MGVALSSEVGVGNHHRLLAFSWGKLLSQPSQIFNTNNCTTTPGRRTILQESWDRKEDRCVKALLMILSKSFPVIAKGREIRYYFSSCWKLYVAAMLEGQASSFIS